MNVSNLSTRLFPRLLTRNTILIAGGLLLAVLLPLSFKSDNYTIFLFVTILIYAVLASAWNIIGGMAGQFDLGMAVHLGLGAFVTGTLLIRWQITPIIGIFVGGIVAALFALLLGFPLFGFKIKELWYSLTTSALVEVMRVAFMMWDDVAGPTEKYLPILSSPILSMRFNTYLPYYYILLVLLIIILFVNRRIRYTKLGYSLLALGEDEDAVEVLGVDSRASKLKALVIYAFIVGLVGGLYACIYGYIHPAFFDTSKSMEIAILGIVGGLGMTYGPLTAAILMVSIKEMLRANISGGLEGLYLIVYSVILILIVLFRPGGLTSIFEEAVAAVRARIGVKKDVPTTAKSN